MPDRGRPCLDRPVSMAPETCPNCGAEVPPDAVACPECGADDETGWNDRAQTQRLGISDPDDFSAEEYLRNEVDTPVDRPRSLFWWAVAVAVLIGFAWLLLPK